MLEQCQKHVIATEMDFTNFQSIQSSTDNSTFRFYSIPETEIRFAFTAVLDGVQNNFYAAEYLTFRKFFIRIVSTKMSIYTRNSNLVYSQHVFNLFITLFI